MPKPVFSAEIDKALDAYVVPPLAPGFSDRLMNRIASGDTGLGVTTVAAPQRHARRTSPWRRTSRIVGSVALLSFATATAAAAGFFGKPVYLPVISEALAEAKIVDTPKAVVKSETRTMAKVTPANPVGKTQSLTTGSAAIINRMNDLRSNPDIAKLTPEQQRVVVGREIRKMVRAGEASRQDVRAAARDLVKNADPATRKAWRDAAAERRERRGEVARRRTPPPAASAAAGADSTTNAGEAPPTTEPAARSPEQIQALRERFLNATPEQRAAMRRAIRERRLIPPQPEQ